MGGGGGGGGGGLRHSAVQTDFEFEISGPLLYNLYNTHEFILRLTWCHVKNELVGVV